MAEKRRSRRAAADGVRGAGWTARQAGALHLEATERAWPLFRARSKSYERTWLSGLGFYRYRSVCCVGLEGERDRADAERQDTLQ